MDVDSVRWKRTRRVMTKGELQMSMIPCLTIDLLPGNDLFDFNG